MAKAERDAEKHATPRWLFALMYALMGPACGINGAFIALSIPALAPYGMPAVLAAGACGAVLGILPALWLARRIGEGIREKV